MHILNLTYSNNKNCKLLTIQDNSYYDISFPITNVIFEIKPPGADCFIPFTLTHPWCSKTFSCLEFKMCCIGESTVLPDGIYEIKYSLDPNLNTLIEIQHLRVCQLMTLFTTVLGNYLSKKCNLTIKEKEEVEKKLSEINDMINAAIYSVEECLDNEEGMKLYEEAQKRLKELENGESCSCH